jgi:hypothetical protein
LMEEAPMSNPATVLAFLPKTIKVPFSVGVDLESLYQCFRLSEIFGNCTNFLIGQNSRKLNLC